MTLPPLRLLGERWIGKGDFDFIVEQSPYTFAPPGLTTFSTSSSS
jgi:hypothetical protein